MRSSSICRAVATMALGAVLAAACAAQHPPVTTPPRGPDVPLATIKDPAPGAALVFIAYGDMRFTDAAEVEASRPQARRALVARIAGERPAALFLNGDVPWHGGTNDDYGVYAAETAAWREAQIAVFPALGNHEFSRCEPAACLENWWSAFPALRDHRWYAIALGAQVYALNLDSNASLLPGSDQRVWLEAQITRLAPGVRFVLISLHHPPVADLQAGRLADHNPRPNEVSLADYLDRVARTGKARYIVSAGHIHNYERNERNGVVYLVSGGGGAHPYEIVRAGEDLFQGTEPENFHYVRFELRGGTLTARMIRLANPAAPARDAQWQVADEFTVDAVDRR